MRTAGLKRFHYRDRFQRGPAKHEETGGAEGYSLGERQVKIYFAQEDPTRPAILVSPASQRCAESGWSRARQLVSGEDGREWNVPILEVLRLCGDPVGGGVGERVGRYRPDSDPDTLRGKVRICGAHDGCVVVFAGGAGNGRGVENGAGAGEGKRQAHLDERESYGGL